MKILIVGGYGVFGGRLAELLANIEDVELLICGRNLAQATEFCGGYQGRAQIKPLQLDRDEIEPALEAECPDLVVDASGPFQAYGDNQYKLVQACIAAKIDYLDFADAADFVFGISQFDNAAKEAGIFILSGASSFPVLTAAVLREMAKTMDITSISGGIAPSPYAGIGLNVMRAVVGYAGEPVKLHRNGTQIFVPGLTESKRFSVAVPGRMPLKNIRFSLVDVPDLQVIPPEHRALKDIWMGAGPVPELLLRVLNLLAMTRAKFKLPPLVPLSGLFYKVLNLMKFGEHRGGMFVHAFGQAHGAEVEQSWHMLAEGDDGPYIPSMTIEAIIRKLLSGQRPETGARAATRALDLSDYENLFLGRTIYSAMRTPALLSAPLYRRVLGDAFDSLPSKVKEIHDSTKTRIWAGNAEVKRGRGWIALAIAKVLGFPNATKEVLVSVTLAPERGGEMWTRNFGGKIFSSFQTLGAGKNDYLLVERFGLINVSLALVVEEEKLFLVPRRWSCVGIPLPSIFLPSGQSFEAERDGIFCFDVEIAAPLIGLIVAYKGRLKLQLEK